MTEVRAHLKFGDQEWAVTWQAESNTPAYMASQFAFEAKRAAERANEEENS